MRLGRAALLALALALAATAPAMAAAQAGVGGAAGAAVPVPAALQGNHTAGAAGAPLRAPEAGRSSAVTGPASATARRALRRGADERPAHGLIVRLREVPGGAEAGDASWQAVARSGGLESRAWRRVGARARLLAADRLLSGVQARELAQRLRERPEVAWVEPNVREHRLQALVVPDDPLFERQWWLQPVSGADGNALNDRLRGVPGLQTAWSTASVGDDAGLIAVLDTGITAHPELQGRVIAGHDFVSELAYANDGDGRDADPADPGDWVDDDDRRRDPAAFGTCETAPSSWHGTSIAGQLVAQTDNRRDVAAAQWRGRVLAVRVAGKCGATVADIVDGLRWAAGLPVDGVPPNPNPARILTISFGGSAPCSRAYQDAVDAVRAQGAVLVAAAGNGPGPVSRPASCRGVIGVGAVNRDGFKAGYSNFGPELALATVGGDPAGEGAWGELLGDPGVFTLTDAGREAPQRGATAFRFGTSFSAPIVAATAGLMLAVNPALSADQLTEGLRRTVRPHVASSFIDECSAGNPGRCRCGTATCGAGLLDAPEALRYAADPASYVPLARSPAVNDSAEVRQAAALGPDAPPLEGEGADASNGGGGGGALGAPWLLALAAAGLAARSTVRSRRARRASPADPGDTPGPAGGR